MNRDASPPQPPDNRATDLHHSTAPPGRSGEMGVGRQSGLSAEDEGRRMPLEAQKLESLGLLAAGMAHDFNNLLQLIIAYTDLARHEQERSGLLEFLTQIRAAGQRGAQLTRQILTFSRRQPIEFAPLELNELLSPLAEMLRRLVVPGVEIQTNLQNNLPLVLADRGQIEQVVMNLVLNACDSMEEGGEILIQTRVLLGALWATKESGPRDAVALVVQDNGSGIPADVLPRIFEPFFTTKERARGTGLGLSVVHGIIRQHGGQIRVESRIGQGTEFTILLPVAKVAPAAPSAPQSPPRPHRGGLVLIAEDDPLLRTVIERMLARHGYRTLTAVEGRDAIRIFREHTGEPIALFVFDALMPQLNGLEAFHQLRDDPGCPPLLLMSGYPRETPQSSAEGRRVHYLRKPFSEEELLLHVSRTLELGATRSA